MKRFKKITISIFIVLLTLFIGGSSLVGVLFYNLALNANYSKDIIYAEYNDENLNDAQKWLEEKSNYSDKYIEPYDKLQLHSYVVTQNSNKWAIVVHGYGGSGKLMSDKSKYFYDMGYNVLIPDLRGHGKSEGTYIGMGWHERFDIVDLSNYIASTYKNSQIVLFGVSMGAATVMSASGEKLPRNVKVIIEDCGYTSTWSQFAYQLKALFKLPSFPMMHISSIICKFRAGYFISEASPIKQIKKSTTPTLFIHGDKDGFVPFFMLDELYNASPVEKEKLIINGAAHARASYVNPKLYWKTVEKFLNNYIN